MKQIPVRASLDREKRRLRKKGWSYRLLALYLGVTYQYVSEVLNGNRQSRRLIARIAAAPPAGRKWGEQPKRRHRGMADGQEPAAAGQKEAA